MSGHSKWSSIKHKKALTDAKKGQQFTKMAREITSAAREGGGSPDGNYRLRLAMEKARDVNMPQDNVARAIKRGTGELGGATLEELRFEGYGPHGVAIMVDTLTDNRNRTSGESRNLFSRAGGNLGATGGVAWMFTRQGQIVIDANGGHPEEIGLAAVAMAAGLADTGYGAVRRQNGRLFLVTCGTVKTPANISEPKRLGLLAEQLRALMAELRPQAAAFEELFFSKNVRTAMAVGQARGVALLSAVEAGAAVHEYTPNQVKLSVTGYGGATKGQMLKMVQSLLATRELPRSDDAIDALAVAICHHHSGRLRMVISRAPAQTLVRR